MKKSLDLGRWTAWAAQPGREANVVKVPASLRTVCFHKSQSHKVLKLFSCSGVKEGEPSCLRERKKGGGGGYQNQRKARKERGGNDLQFLDFKPKDVPHFGKINVAGNEGK